MDNQTTVDRSILIPIGVGAISIIGIIVVLLVGRWFNSPAQVAVTESATPFQFVFLGTEPAIVTPLFEGSVIPGVEEPIAEEPIEPPPVLVTPTRRATSAPILLTLPGTVSTPTGGGLQTSTPPPTTTSASAAPLNPGTYDDVHASILKNGWQPTTAGGVTLHVSNVPGSTISFRFIGTGLRLFYQGNNTLGEVRVTVDNTSETLDQSEGTEWVWPDSLANGTHSVVITHISGGSVNLDQVIIPEVSGTPTLTRTPTPTPTQ